MRRAINLWQVSILSVREVTVSVGIMRRSSTSHQVLPRVPLQWGMPQTLEPLNRQAFSRATRDAASHTIQRTPAIPGSLQHSAVPFVHSVMGELFLFHPLEELIYSGPWSTSLLDHIGRTPVLDTAMCDVRTPNYGQVEGRSGRSREESPSVRPIAGGPSKGLGSPGYVEVDGDFGRNDDLLPIRSRYLSLHGIRTCGIVDELPGC